MTTHTPPPAPEPLDASERELARLLGGLPDATPPPQLDARVLDQARRAVAMPLQRRPLRGWRSVGMGAAASVLLAVGLLVHLRGVGPASELPTQRVATDEEVTPVAPARKTGPATDAAGMPAPRAVAAPVPKEVPPPPPPVPPIVSAQPSPMSVTAPPPAPPPKEAEVAPPARSAEAFPAAEEARAQIQSPPVRPAPAPPRAPSPVAQPAPSPAEAAEFEMAASKQQAAEAGANGPIKPATRADETPAAAAIGRAAGGDAAAALRKSGAENRQRSNAPAQPATAHDATIAFKDLAVTDDAQLPSGPWLQRIRDRLAAGDRDGARASLRAFHQRHPDIVIPADLNDLLP